MFLEYNRSKIEGRYEQLRREFPDVFGPADEKINGCREPVALALKWMYGAMPWSDRGNYDLELNTSTLTTEECARILFAAMEK